MDTLRALQNYYHKNNENKRKESGCVRCEKESSSSLEDYNREIEGASGLGNTYRKAKICAPLTKCS